MISKLLLIFNGKINKKSYSFLKNILKNINVLYSIYIIIFIVTSFLKSFILSNNNDKKHAKL